MAEKQDVVSPSLLKDLNGSPRKLSKERQEELKLSAEEWKDDDGECEAKLAPKPKKRLSLVKRPKQKENRWGFVDATRQETLCQKFVPKSTSTNTKWVVSNFCSWRDSRNVHAGNGGDDLVPTDLLKTTDAAMLSKWLALYAAETRKHETSSAPWFSMNPIGRNTLAKMVKEICSDGNIAGHKTNHSLRATGASELYHAGVPENIIKERTGHMSLTGLHHYEHTADSQHRVVSQILQSKEVTTYQKELVNTVSTGSQVQMHFSNCSVAIYNAPQSNPAPPPPPPPPELK